MAAKLKEIKDEMRRPRHDLTLGTWLQQVVTGFFAYHAVPTNFHALLVFRAHVKDLWRRAL